MRTRESRPADDRAAITENTDGRSETSLPGRPENVPHAGATSTTAEWHAYLDAWGRGYCEGIDHGRRQAEAELAALQRAAAAIVHAAAESPPRDAAADRERAARREAWWAVRRGEAGAA